jgi:uncharacterized protein
MTVAGNHDDWARVGRRELRGSRLRAGGGLLSTLGSYALGPVTLYSVSSLAKAPKVSETGTVRLSAFHNPLDLDGVQRLEFDMALAGHSHGGQIRLPLLGAMVLPGGVGAYDRGLYRKGGHRLLVTAGIDTWLIDACFLRRPEMVMFSESGR